MRRAAVFDLDGTLLAGTSAERLLLPWLRRRGVVGWRAMGRALAKAATLPWTGATHALRANKLWLAGVDADDVRVGMPDFVSEALDPRWSPSALERLEDLRARGFALHLLTGAPDFVAAAVAERLAMDGFLGTRLEIQGGRFTGRLAGPHLFGEAKREAVRALARAERLDLAGSCGFADHPSDLAFLECFGAPVAVSPRRRLLGVAEARGWEVLEAGPSPRALGGRTP